MPRTKFPLAEQVRRSAESPVEKSETISTSQLVSTGSTLLNLACSDNPFGGFALGKMVNLIGDSSSGKTFLALSVFAEMSQKKRFLDYRFIFDDVEAASEFNLENLFGKRAASRIELLSSNTTQDFLANILKAIDKKKPFVYVLDSFDALTSDEEITKVRKTIKSRESGKEIPGSYGMEKPKQASQLLRMICRALKKTKSLLIIISQTRDNINPMSFTKKTRSGGRALQFYAAHEIWLAVSRKHERHGRMIGIDSRAKISKNKLTGKIREVPITIYYDYGVDSVGSCVNWLVEEEHWQQKKNTIIAKELHLEGTVASLIRQIEKRNLEKELKKIVGKAWNRIEENLKLNRKKKYL